MPKATSGGASNAWLENEPGYQPPVESEAVPVEAAEVPADAEVKLAGESGPELTGLPEGTVMLGTPDSMHGAEGLTVLKAAPPVASMSKAELQDHADSLGLPTDGTKADLAARIVEHHETAGAAGAPDAGPEA